MKFSFKNGIAMGAVLFSNWVFAGAQFPCGSDDHFYVGGNMGIASLTDKESTDNPIRDVHYLSSTGFVGGGLFGYDFTLRDQVKLGLEGFINTTDLNLSANQNYSPVTSYTVNMRYNAGIRLLPGYEFTPGTVGHVIIGYSYAQFKINDNGNYGIINKRFNKNGLQLGLGVKTSLFQFKNLSLRTDVLYTAYSSQTSNGVTTTTPPGVQVYHNQLATLEGNLALIYQLA